MLKRMTSTLACAAALMAVGASGCGKQEFSKLTETRTASSVGFRQIPGKVDILIVADNSASINTAWSRLQTGLYNFANSLTSQFWDYHVGRVAMVTSSTPTFGLHSILVNSEFNRDTLSDGTFVGNFGLVPDDKATSDAASFATKLMPQNEINSSIGAGQDTTYYQITRTLQAAAADGYTNFLRPDAMLAVIVITNGREGSVDAVSPFGSVDNTTALAQHAANILAIKGGDQRLVRFYPIAAYGTRLGGTSTDSCLELGGTAINGGSYFAMNSYIAGLPMYNGSGQELLNFCNSVSLQNVLSDINTNLKSISQSYVYSNLVLDIEPVESTIVVTKTSTTGTSTSVPKGGPNGWAYAGLRSVYTITHIIDQNGNLVPIPCASGQQPDYRGNCGLNKRTGYVIELNGTGRMFGGDRPNVQFDPQ